MLVERRAQMRLEGHPSERDDSMDATVPRYPGSSSEFSVANNTMVSLLAHLILPTNDPNAYNIPQAKGRWTELRRSRFDLMPFCIPFDEDSIAGYGRT